MRNLGRSERDHALVGLSKLLLDFINLGDAETQKGWIALNQHLENALPPGEIEFDGDMFARRVQSCEFSLQWLKTKFGKLIRHQSALAKVVECCGVIDHRIEFLLELAK